MKINMAKNNMMVLGGWAALMSQPKLPIDDLDCYIENQEKAKDKLDWMTYSNINSAITCCFIIQDMVNDDEQPSVEAFMNIAWTADKFQYFEPVTNVNPQITINNEKCTKFLNDLITVNSLERAQEVWDKWHEQQITSFGSQKAVYFLIQYQLAKNGQWSFDPNHQTIVDFNNKVLMAYEADFRKYKWF